MSEEVEEKPVLTSLWLAVLWVPRDLHEIALIYRGPHLSGSVSHSSMCSLSQNKLSEQSITLCSHPQKHVDHCQLRLCYSYYIGPVSLKLFYSHPRNEDVYEYGLRISYFPTHCVLVLLEFLWSTVLVMSHDVSAVSNQRQLLIYAYGWSHCLFPVLYLSLLLGDRSIRSEWRD